MEIHRFLTKDEILCIHREMVKRYGGTLQVWDEGKLDAAIEAPKSGFGGVRAHSTIWEIGAAYWFHISQAHAFESANKRTAAEACLTFLFLNGFTLECDQQALEQMGIGVATGQITESELACWLETHAAST